MIKAGALFIIFLSLLIATLALLTILLWIVKNKRMGNDTAHNPYSPTVHRCACITWCCGCGFTINAFCVGGLLVMLGLPLSGVCLLLDDLDGQLLKDILPAINADLDTTSQSFESMVNILDQCFANPNSTHPTNLLGLLMIEDKGETKSMRQKLEGDIKGQIDASFDKVTAGGSAALSQEDGILTLKATMAGLDIASTIVPAGELGATMAADDNYKPMVGDWGLETLKTAFVTTSSCTDTPVKDAAGNPKMDDNGNPIIAPGIDSFVVHLKKFGFNPSAVPVAISSTCAKKVVCVGISDTSHKAMCDAGNKFMDLKEAQLQALTKEFRCDVFAHPDTPSVNCNAWTNNENYKACVKEATDGSLKINRLEVRCTLAEFVTYVKSFENKIAKIFEALDTEVDNTKTSIVTGLRALLNKHLLEPIAGLVAGMTCNFLGLSFQAFIDGLCFQAVVGFDSIANSYVGCAVISMMLVIVMYIVWRLRIDNYNCAKEKIGKNDPVEAFGEGASPTDPLK